MVYACCGLLCLACGGSGRAQTISREACPTFSVSYSTIEAPSSPTYGIGLLKVIFRTTALRNGTTAYNVSPISWDVYDTIGKHATSITDRQAITDILGCLHLRMIISTETSRQLETALGLNEGSLGNGFKIREIHLTLFPAQRIQVPQSGNSHFLGKGKGLPGGGPELILCPKVSTRDNAEVSTIAVVTIH